MLTKTGTKICADAEELQASAALAGIHGIVPPTTEVLQKLKEKLEKSPKSKPKHVQDNPEK